MLALAAEGLSMTPIKCKVRVCELARSNRGEQILLAFDNPDRKLELLVEHGALAEGGDFAGLAHGDVLELSLRLAKSPAKKKKKKAKKKTTAKAKAKPPASEGAT